MKGGLYSTQKCFCGNTFKDNRIDRLSCPHHPDQVATKIRVKIGTTVSPILYSYRDANELLWTWRGEIKVGTFDPRAYGQESKIGFTRLVEQYLDIMEESDVRVSTIRRYKCLSRNLISYLGDTPVTKIDFGVLQDMAVSLKRDQDLSAKTIYDAYGFLYTFFTWCVDRAFLKSIPKKPKLSKRMGMRKILDKKTQGLVLCKVHDIYGKIVPRVPMGIEILATYPKIRPGELLQVNECHVDLTGGYLTIPSPKEQSDPKVIKLIDRHVKQLRELPRGLPNMPFFRFDYPIRGKGEGKRLGRDYLQTAWARACEELGIEGVPLYPGTKHTSATDLAKKYPYSLVKQAAGVTSKAMERYINLSEADFTELYESAAPEKVAPTSMAQRRS